MMKKFLCGMFFLGFLTTIVFADDGVLVSSATPQVNLTVNEQIVQQTILAAYQQAVSSVVERAVVAQRLNVAQNVMKEVIGQTLIQGLE